MPGLGSLTRDLAVDISSMATDRAEFIDKLRKVGFFENPEFENAKIIDDVRLAVPEVIDSKLDMGFLIDEETTTESTHGERSDLDQITASQILEILDHFESERLEPSTRSVKTEPKFESVSDVELKIEDLELIDDRLIDGGSNFANQPQSNQDLSIQVSANQTEGSGEEADETATAETAVETETVTTTQPSHVSSQPDWTTNEVVEKTLEAAELLSTTQAVETQNQDERFYQDLGSLFGEGLLFL